MSPSRKLGCFVWKNIFKFRLTLNIHVTLLVNGQNRKLNEQIQCPFNIQDKVLTCYRYSSSLCTAAKE